MKQKTKLLFVLNDMEFGGIQKSLVMLLKHLVEQNLYDIDVLLWRKNGPLLREIPHEVNILFNDYPPTLDHVRNEAAITKKVNTITHYIRYQYFSKVIKKPWMFNKKMSKIYDIAISYTHTGYPPFFVIDNVKANKKFLWYHHGSYEKSGAAKALDKKYFEKYNKVIAVSASNKKLLNEEFESLKGKLEIVPNIIDVVEIIKKSNEDKPSCLNTFSGYTFVTVSRFSKEKGLDLAIEVACILKERGLEFKWYFVGDGDTLDEVKAMVEQKKLGDVCVFTGKKENPYVYMKHADLYIQTSYVEAHPITINEALVLDKLIVTTDLPSTREVLKDGKLGVLSNPERKQFANAILYLLQNKDSQNILLEAVKMHRISNDETYHKINTLLAE